MNSAGPKPYSKVSIKFLVWIGTAWISTLCSSRKRSNPGSINVGRMLSNVCEVRGLLFEPTDGEPPPEALGDGQVKGRTKRPSMRSPWL